MKFAFVLVALALGFPIAAFAHGINFLQQQAGEYYVDVGYNVVVVTPNSPVVFDFLLWKDAEQTQGVAVSNVWFRIEDENGKPQFNVNIGQPALGRLALLYAFPRAGNYTLQVRYEKEGTVLAESSFPLTVEADGAGTAGTGNSHDFFVGGVFGLLAGGALAYFLLRRR